MEAIFYIKLINNQNEIITPEIAKTIEACGIEKVMIKSAIHCKAKNCICRHFFVNDLTTNKPVEISTAICVVDAQSIGESGTQLNLRIFHMEIIILKNKIFLFFMYLNDLLIFDI